MANDQQRLAWLARDSGSMGEWFRRTPQSAAEFVKEHRDHIDARMREEQQREANRPDPRTFADHSEIQTTLAALRELREDMLAYRDANAGFRPSESLAYRTSKARESELCSRLAKLTGYPDGSF